MKLLSTLAVIGVLAAAQPAFAQLSAYEDYDISESVTIVTTIKVDSNMSDYYLEGLKSSWVESSEVAKKLGHIEDYAIYGSAFPESGDFNMVLLTSFKSMGDIGPSKAKYEAFMKEWGKQNEEKSRAISKTYPDVRTITGEYVLHEITMK